MLSPDLTPRLCERALAARDPRFDGLFFVGITSTRIYCRPICPSRLANPERRRFFESTVAAEKAGFRPCLRCRPELAPGRAPVDAISRLAHIAASRIEAGALNGRSIGQLATELGVSARHLRRVLEREYGISPGVLARSYRLLLAKRLLTDTTLSVTRIAFSSGFQSLRRFNAVFRDQYRMSPTALRRTVRTGAARPGSTGDCERLSLTLGYRAPFDWTGLLTLLGYDALPGVEAVEGLRYARTVSLEGARGTVVVENREASRQLRLQISTALAPVLMPLIPRLRRLFDLDAQPGAIDTHLARAGLAALVRRHPGVRLPGCFDPFEVALRSLVRAGMRSEAGAGHLLRRLIWTLGEPAPDDVPGLTHSLPTPARVAGFGEAGLRSLGLPSRAAECVVRVARAMAVGALRLEPGREVEPALGALIGLGVAEPVATRILLRTLQWPDAFPPAGRSLLHAAGASDEATLLERAEAWRPWRAYAALHLWLCSQGTAPARQRATG